MKMNRQNIGSFEHSSGAGTTDNLGKNLSSIENARQDNEDNTSGGFFPNANGSTASYGDGSQIAIAKSDHALFEYAEEEKVSFERSASKNGKDVKSSSDNFISNADIDKAPKRDRMKSSRIITDSMRKKDNEMKHSHGRLGRMETIIEEKS